MSSTLARPTLAVVMALMLLVSAAASVIAYHSGELWQGYHPPAHVTFKNTHARTDQPVIDGVKRTWVWGPQAYTEGMLEPYADSPGGMRLVQYYDKSRMEINFPGANQDSFWYVSNGLLVVDMVEGQRQIGTSEFDQSPEPADFAVAGDQDGMSEITYAAIGSYGLRQKPALVPGTLITQTIKNGEVVQDNAFAGYGVTGAYRLQVDGIDHTVASVFWDFMNSKGTVYVNHIAATDHLFANPFYATGYPITEAYWGTVNVAGYPRTVLWQCFERRCLTYTPGNPTGWEVEAGNVGQHYFRWTYGVQGPAMMNASVGLVALEDNGANGPKIGCDDSLIMKQTEIQQFAKIEDTIRAAIQRQLVTEEAGLTNILHGQNLIVEHVTVSGSTATVHLVGGLTIGGICDVPRVQETIRATATQFGQGITNVNIKLNGQDWPGQL